MNSSLRKLDPYVDFDGVMRVGGRLNKGQLSEDEKNPIIIPSQHHVAKLIIEFYHRKSKHQGRHITGGAVRSAGFWIVYLLNPVRMCYMSETTQERGNPKNG